MKKVYDDGTFRMYETLVNKDAHGRIIRDEQGQPECYRVCEELVGGRWESFISILPRPWKPA